MRYKEECKGRELDLSSRTHRKVSGVRRESRLIPVGVATRA
jgi:hypothetical protein